MLFFNEIEKKRYYTENLIKNSFVLNAYYTHIYIYTFFCFFFSFSEIFVKSRSLGHRMFIRDLTIARRESHKNTFALLF
jgi:hypothetical protein